MFQTKFVYKSKGIFHIEQTLSDNRAVYEIMGGKYGTDRQATDGSIKADSHIACRSHAVPLPCRATKGLKCVFPI
jgi:hypothetical protein